MDELERYRIKCLLNEMSGENVWSGSSSTNKS